MLIALKSCLLYTVICDYVSIHGLQLYSHGHKMCECSKTHHISADIFIIINYTINQDEVPLPSPRQRPSYDDCLEVKRKYYQHCSMLDCVTQMFSQQHTYMSSSYRSNRLGLSYWDPYTVRRGGCLELYYCNMKWFWWDSSLISTVNWFPSVL